MQLKPWRECLEKLFEDSEKQRIPRLLEKKRIF
jgi:hypothetical protein